MAERAYISAEVFGMPRQQNALGVLADEKCPIRGCSDRRTEDGLVCLSHSVAIWQHVQSVKGQPFVADAITESVAERERREAANERRLAEVRKTHGSIYYIRLDDKIKIGWSSNLGQRLASYPPHMQLLTDHPGTRADERDLHRSFKPSRAAGREWYHPTQELMAHIARVDRAEMERRTSEHWARVERQHGTEHMLRVRASSERMR